MMISRRPRTNAQSATRSAQAEPPALSTAMMISRAEDERPERDAVRSGGAAGTEHGDDDQQEGEDERPERDAVRTVADAVAGARPRAPAIGGADRHRRRNVAADDHGAALSWKERRRGL